MPRMYHDDPKMTGGPTTADVPEEAVGWMQKAGWYLKPDTAPETAPEPARANGKAATPAKGETPSASAKK